MNCDVSMQTAFVLYHQTWHYFASLTTNSGNSFDYKFTKDVCVIYNDIRSCRKPFGTIIDIIYFVFFKNGINETKNIELLFVNNLRITERFTMKFFVGELRKSTLHLYTPSSLSRKSWISSFGGGPDFEVEPVPQWCAEFPLFTLPFLAS